MFFLYIGNREHQIPNISQFSDHIIHTGPLLLQGC